MDEFMSYEEYLDRVKEGIVTDMGNCPVTPLLHRPYILFMAVYPATKMLPCRLMADCATIPLIAITIIWSAMGRPNTNISFASFPFVKFVVYGLWLSCLLLNFGYPACSLKNFWYAASIL